MKLRYASDRRTLLWTFGLFPSVVAFACTHPHGLLWTLPLALYVGFCAGIFAHNHNHCPTFHGRLANALFGAWLSAFYGHPVFAWIPTHNTNHHKYRNGPGDATITWRYSKHNTWFAASTYFFVSAYWQSPLITAFIARARAASPRLYRRIVVETVAVRGAHAMIFATAILLHGWRTGAIVYAATFGAAMAGGLWGTMFVNFIQHADCDPASTHDHWRNFVSKVGNFFAFNNGFHTAHHEQPGTHWSLLPALHAQIAGAIHPELCQPSILGFCARTYLLGTIWPSFRTRQIGRPAYAPRALSACRRNALAARASRRCASRARPAPSRR